MYSTTSSSGGGNNDKCDARSWFLFSRVEIIWDVGEDSQRGAAERREEKLGKQSSTMQASE